MNYAINWDNADQTVVYQQYKDEACREDMYQMARESSDMLRSVAHTVHLIIDERPTKITLNPTDMDYLERNVPPNQGALVLLVDKNGLAYKKLLQDVGRAYAPKAFEQPYFAESLDEARQFLQDKFAVHYP